MKEKENIDGNMYEDMTIDFNYEDYIIAIPSGQVIDMMHSELMTLRDIGYVWFDNKKIYHYMCKDEMVGKIYQFLQRNKEDFKRSQIEEFLKNCGLLKDQYKIFDDLSVDVYSSINMSYNKLFSIPFKFNRCTSNFNCSFNYLLDLKNAPREVHGVFNCSFNNLKNLIGGPRLISSGYNCSNNKLVSLKGAPVSINNFNCSYNNLKSLEHSPKVKDLMISHNNPFEKNQI